MDDLKHHLAIMRNIYDRCLDEAERLKLYGSDYSTINLLDWLIELKREIDICTQRIEK